MTLSCNGRLIDLQTPRIMGILNLTPDSFFEQSRQANVQNLLQNANQMLTQGATFLDLGGYSSRPGAAFVSESEEIDRLLPAVRALVKEFPHALLSIDTFRAEVAKACVGAGAAMINDISAGMLDPNMLSVVAQLRVPYVMMHMRGNPQNMQQFTQYEDLVQDVLAYFAQRIAAARALGISDIILDPGFGFSKTLDQNYELLQKMDLLQLVNLPVLVGVSRKSMICKVLDISPEEALTGTTVINTIALQKGARILRVHDVQPAVEAVKIFEKTFIGGDTVRRAKW